MGKRIIRNFVLLLGLFCIVNMEDGYSQDPSFSQSYANPLYLSPSFTGLTNGSRVSMGFRDQWPGIPNAYRTMAFSFDHYLDQYNSGVGLLMMRDSRGGGMLVTQDVGVLYSYEIEISKDIFVRPGIQFKYAERVIDPSKFVFGSDIDHESGEIARGVASFDRDNFKRFDASASGMVYSDDFWVGFTLDHIVKSNIGFTDVETHVPVRTTLFGGYKYKYREGFKNRDEQSITVTLNYHRQQDFHQSEAGFYWYSNPIELGLLYRGLPFKSEGYSNTDAIVFVFGINFGLTRFAYSYDLSTSDLAGFNYGANEFSLIYRFNQAPGKKVNSRGAMPCSAPGASISTNKYRTKPRKIF